MSGYYSVGLSGERLKQCYELAPPRVQQYLAAEIDHARSLIEPSDTVLELGSGYGRILVNFAADCRTAVGIDSSLTSLQFGRRHMELPPNCFTVCTDAARLPFADGLFDKVFCLQNGISAFKISPASLIIEALRVLRPGGIACFSTYAEAFWPDRLAWFRIQSNAGLVGPIDEEKTGSGVISCADGFVARTASRKEFLELARSAGAVCRVYAVDDSSLFAEFRHARR